MPVEQSLQAKVGKTIPTTDGHDKGSSSKLRGRRPRGHNEGMHHTTPGRGNFLQRGSVVDEPEECMGRASFISKRKGKMANTRQKGALSTSRGWVLQAGRNGMEKVRPRSGLQKSLGRSEGGLPNYPDDKARGQNCSKRRQAAWEEQKAPSIKEGPHLRGGTMHRGGVGGDSNCTASNGKLRARKREGRIRRLSGQNQRQG